MLINDRQNSFILINTLFYSLDLTPEGDALVIGAQGTTAFGINRDGYVKVFDREGGKWLQLEKTITGDATGNEFGNSVSLSATGETMTKGSPGQLSPNNLDPSTFVFD